MLIFARLRAHRRLLQHGRPARHWQVRKQAPLAGGAQEQRGRLAQRVDARRAPDARAARAVLREGLGHPARRRAAGRAAGRHRRGGGARGRRGAEAAGGRQDPGHLRGGGLPRAADRARAAVPARQRAAAQERRAAQGHPGPLGPPADDRCGRAAPGRRRGHHGPPRLEPALQDAGGPEPGPGHGALAPGHVLPGRGVLGQAAGDCLGAARRHQRDERLYAGRRPGPLARWHSQPCLLRGRHLVHRGDP
mmetsp:Transcript_60626/g.188278  ORF Transcript_60626/g.188278 Transcript_60626/m.188278 type:complete len:249 (+) Transcript_60626:44-790(+)